VQDKDHRSGRFALPRLASGKALNTNVISAIFNMLAIQRRVAASW
jgi:hypothetical protein